MAARYFYVSSVVGTNVGLTDTSFATKQTGTMAALESANPGYVYDSIYRVMSITAPPIDGDFILVASNHNASHTNEITIAGSTLHTGAGLALMSVDFNNIAVYLAGAKETSTTYINFKNNVYSAGIDYENGNATRVLAPNSYVTFQDCRLTGTGADRVIQAYYSCRLKLYNVEIETNSTIAFGITCWAGAHIELYGCKSISTVVTERFIECLEGTILLHGCNLSDMSGTLLYNYGVSGNEEALVGLYNCQLNSAVTIPSAVDLGAPRQRFEMYGCDDSTNDRQFRFLVLDNAGNAHNTTDTVYVNNTEAWYGGSTKTSIRVDPFSTCSLITPFTFKLPTEYIDFAATGILDIYITSVSAIDDSDVSFFMVYPDSNVSVQPNLVGNLGVTWTPNPMKTLIDGSGNAFTATSDVWNVARTNQYKITLDTSTDAGGVGAPDIYVSIYSGGLGDTIFIDTEISAKS